MDTSSTLHFLHLPLEVRLMIYKLFLPLPVSAMWDRWIYHPGHTIFLISRNKANSEPRISSLGRAPRLAAHQTGILALRAVNRQLWRETKDLISVDPVKLRIIDSLTFKDCSNNIVLDLLRNSWMRENIQHLQLYLAEDGVGFTYPVSHSNPGSPQYPSTYGIFLSRVRNYILNQKVQVQKPKDLRKLVAVLETFPKLKTVDILTDRGILFDIWADPWADSSALLALVKRGITVEFKFPLQYNSAGGDIFRDEFDAMLCRKQPWAILSRRPALRWVSSGQNDRRLEAVGD